MIATIHPFPARMAPELALLSLETLPRGSLVLDPMMGSGTVLRHAVELGHSSIGFDMDPLAVLMTRVWTGNVDDKLIGEIYDELRQKALVADPGAVQLPWIDDDQETASFIAFWFGRDQIKELRCIASTIVALEQKFHNNDESIAAIDVIKVALSRIIVTKEQGASLARDTSHSRPHRVALTSNYSVFEGLDRSLQTVRKRLNTHSNPPNMKVRRGDARNLDLPAESIDAVLTSPPYLNAIDYMRGHRMSLVWLGFKLADLRQIRSNSIGAERAPERGASTSRGVVEAMGSLRELPTRYRTMISRYAGDLSAMLSETARVLKPAGQATFVVGNSCLKGIFVNNAEGVAAAASEAGLVEKARFERDLPDQNRYLPTPRAGSLGKRMRTETIITFTR